MGLRFRKSIKLGGGVRLNLNKKSAGLSVGGKGFRYSANTSGRRTTAVGIPGSGLSYSRTSSGRSRGTSRSGTTSAPTRPQPVAAGGPAALPKPGLFAPGTEKRFYEGVQAYLKEAFPKALKAFEEASAKDSRNVSDDLFAGLVAMKLEQPARAIPYFEQVVASDVELPDQLMQKYLPAHQVELQLSINITPRLSAPVPINSLGAALILAELYQEADQREQAIGVLQQLSDELADEPALKLSLCELLYEDGDDEGVIETAAGVTNDSDIELACLHWKGKALARQGLSSAALETFTACLKRTTGRDPELLKEIRYDRATLYETTGQASRARADWEKLYAADPTFRDVAQRALAR